MAWWAGNTKPAWEDLGFALVRRLVPFYLRREVKKKDMLLMQRVAADTMDALLYKLTSAYLDARLHYRNCNPSEEDPYRPGRKVFPKTIMQFNETIRSSMNPLFCMLQDGLGSCPKPMFMQPGNNDIYITLDAFTTQYVFLFPSFFSRLAPIPL